MDQSVSLGGSAPEQKPDTGTRDINWAEKRATASTAVKATAEYIKVHGKETASYIKTQGSAAAGAAVASTRQTKEEVVREWAKSTGLGSLIYKSVMPAHWRLPAISLGMTILLLAAAIVILAFFASSTGGSLLILMVLPLTLLSQIVHNYCDAALMLQLVLTKDGGNVSSLRQTAENMNDKWEAVLGLSIATWAESVYTLASAIVRGIIFLFQLPFRLCLKPFTIDRPVAAVDTSMQMTIALALVVQENVPARSAVDNAEVYLLQQVGPKPCYTRTLYGMLSVTAFPMLLLGAILAGCGYLAAGYSLIFVSVALSQWVWNICAHVLAVAHYRYTTTGKDDMVLPSGAVDQIYHSTASTLSSLPPSTPSSLPPSSRPGVVEEGRGEETKVEEGGFSTLRV